MSNENTISARAKLNREMKFAYLFAMFMALVFMLCSVLVKDLSAAIVSTFMWLWAGANFHSANARELIQNGKLSPKQTSSTNSDESD